MTLAAVRDLREVRTSIGAEEVEAFEIDVLAGFVMARSSAGVGRWHDPERRGPSRSGPDLVRPAAVGDGPCRCGRLLRAGVAERGTGDPVGSGQAIKTYFDFLELRHQAEIYNLMGLVVACPIDEINRPRGSGRARLRIPPGEEQVAALFAGWRGELVSCRKFAPTARNYAAARLMAEVRRQVNELRHLDLSDVKWDLGRFGKLHVRHGKGSRASGPRERMVPLINNAGGTLCWFVEDVWGQFGDDHLRPGAPLFPSERKSLDGSSGRVGAEALRAALCDAAARHLPDWPARLTPHVLRHFCASQLYLHGVDLVAIQETLGHAWIATTMNYVHVHRPHVEDAWIAGHRRAAQRLKGLLS